MGWSSSSFFVVVIPFGFFHLSEEKGQQPHPWPSLLCTQRTPSRPTGGEAGGSWYCAALRPKNLAAIIKHFCFLRVSSTSSSFNQRGARTDLQSLVRIARRAKRSDLLKKCCGRRISSASGSVSSGLECYPRDTLWWNILTAIRVFTCLTRKRKREVFGLSVTLK